MPFVSEDINALFAEFKLLEKLGFRHYTRISFCCYQCLYFCVSDGDVSLMFSKVCCYLLPVSVCVCSRTPHFPISCVTQTIPDPVSLRLPVSLPSPDTVCGLTGCQADDAMVPSCHDTKITVTSIEHQNPPVCCCCAHCCVI